MSSFAPKTYQSQVLDSVEAVSYTHLDVYKRQTLCIARRTVSLPRKPNDRFDSPPEKWACGQRTRISFTASMKSTA